MNCYLCCPDYNKPPVKQYCPECEKDMQEARAIMRGLHKGYEPVVKVNKAYATKPSDKVNIKLSRRSKGARTTERVLVQAG